MPNPVKGQYKTITGIVRLKVDQHRTFASPSEAVPTRRSYRFRTSTGYSNQRDEGGSTHG